MPHSDEMELVSITVNGGGLAAVGVEEIQPNEMSVVEQLVIRKQPYIPVPLGQGYKALASAILAEPHNAERLGFEAG
jgi:hypothetical protein